MKQTLLFLLVFCLAKAQAQVVVASGTTGMVDAQTQIAFDFQSAGNISIDPSAFDFKNAAFTFLGNVNPNVNIVGSNPLTLASLTIDNKGNYILNQGTIEVTKKLDLVSGIFSVAGSKTKLVYSGTDNLSGSVTSYVDGKLHMKGSGPRTFPIGIGTTGVYLPVTLGDVKDADTEIGFEAILGDPGVPSGALTADIKDVFTDHYWMLSNGNSGTYSGSLISLSLSNTDPFFQDGDPIILELDASGNLNNLLGISAFPDVASTKEGSANGQKYALAKSNAITVRIHRVITPNGDGDNDNLYIEGIDFYTTNTVKLVDRWGVVHFTKENFKNYTTQNPADFDFSKLSNGNYICVVELGSGVKVTPKMISVIK